MWSIRMPSEWASAPCGRHQGQGILFIAQMTDHQHPQVTARLCNGTPGSAGGHDHAGAVALGQGYRSQRKRLQHGDRSGVRERAMRVGIAGRQVAIEVGPREEQPQALRPACSMPGGNGGCRAARMERQHQLVAIRLVIGPFADDPGPMRRKQALPSARGLPVAIVRVGERGRHDHDRGRAILAQAQDGIPLAADQEQRRASGRSRPETVGYRGAASSSQSGRASSS